MKKYVFGILACVLAGGSMLSFSFAETTVKYGLGLNGNNVNGIGVAGAKDASDATEDKGTEPKIVAIIKNTINIALGFLSLITLILLLWSWFKVVTSNGDEKAFTAAMATLKQAALGLWFIAVAWFLVSMIFWFITNTVGTPDQAKTTVETVNSKW